MTPTTPGADWSPLAPALLEPALAGGLGALCLLALAASGRLRCVREEFASWPRRAAALLLLWGILSTTVFYATVAPGDAMAIDTETLWFPSLFVAHALLAGFLLIWWALAHPQPLLRFLRLETAAPGDFAFGLRVGVAGWALALASGAVLAFVLTLFGWEGLSDADGVPGGADLVPPLIAWLADLPLARKLLVIAIAMTVEEAFYRAFLQPRIGWIPSSLLFALSHAGYGLPTLMASVFTVSLVIGWAFRRNGSLLPCIVAHGFFDAVQLLVILPLVVGQMRAAAP